MPANSTHMYVAGRLALDFSSGHPSDVVRDIHRGFKEWLQANQNFRRGADDAINKNDGALMQRVMDTYRAALTTDAVAVFSAFAAGTQGPDLWIVPHGTWDTIINRITGSIQFDLGHYNLSHTFPRAVLERIKAQEKSLPVLQRKYQTAYILGYLSHIALDITAHIKVNVFAGAYFQLVKVWENEFGVFPSDSFLSPNVWNDHNKIEHYADAIIRLVCFEGCHSALSSFDAVRKNDLGQQDGWDFPNYTDYWRHRLRFGRVIKTNGIFDRDEVFLDNSTSLPGPFAARYASSDQERRVVPFIRDDYLRAYALCDAAIANHEKSIVNLESELPKLEFYGMDNNHDIHSQYYLAHWVLPDIDRVNQHANKFFDMSAFAKFVIAGKKTGQEFIDGALKFLDSGDRAVFELLRNWNLDLGLAVRIRDSSAATDSAYPKKPPRPYTIELVNVIDEVKALSDWAPPSLNAGRYGNPRQTWTPPVKAEANPTPGAELSGTSGAATSGVFYAQSGLDVGLSGFKLHSDGDELTAYLWGDKPEPGAAINIPTSEVGYKISRCIEDFVAQDAFASTKDRSAGQASVKEYRSTFLGNIPGEPPVAGVVLGANAFGEYGLRPLPRHLRVSLCRKYVFRPTNSGQFSADRFAVYGNASPTEEVCLSIFMFVRNEGSYTDLFSHAVFSPDQVEELKHIKSIGVNVVLLLLDRDKDASTGRLRLKPYQAYVDGELQDVKAVGGTPKKTPPPIPPKKTPPAGVWRVDFEDAHFRTDSAVLMPDNLAGKQPGGASPPAGGAAEGLDVLKVVHSQLKKQPSQRLLVAGHTDRVGKDAYNISLSADRASGIMFLLEGRKEDWRMLAGRRNHDDDISQVLAWVSAKYGWDCHPGKIENASWSQKHTAILNFQKRYNVEFIDSGRTAKAYPGVTAKRIGEDGDCGPETWGAVFDVYQDALAAKLAATFEGMVSFHASLADRWVDDENKAVPCGETFPREQPLEDNYESAVNRRVEALFFDPPEMPPLPLPCKSGQVAVSRTGTIALSPSSAEARRQSCSGNCPIYRGPKTPEPLPA